MKGKNIYSLLLLSQLMLIYKASCEECVYLYRGGYMHFNGTEDRSVYGHECQRWDSIIGVSGLYLRDSHFEDDGSITAANNYCRDPYGFGKEMFCYTLSPGFTRELCSMAVCDDITGEHVVTVDGEMMRCRIPPENGECDIDELYVCKDTYKVVNSKRKLNDCFELFCCIPKGCWDGPSNYYNGTWRHTTDGTVCRAWNSYLGSADPDPFNMPEMSLDDAMNYCRDPDFTGEPWCYTNKRGYRGSFISMSCGIPSCADYQARHTILSSRPVFYTGWNMGVDIGKKLMFPCIDQTNLRPDIVLRSEKGKNVIIIELTVSRESSYEEAFERMKAKYTEFQEECYGHDCYEITDRDLEQHQPLKETKEICESVPDRVFLEENSEDNLYPGCEGCNCCQKKGCIMGNGSDYMGTWSRTQSGRKCKPWNETFYQGKDELFPDEKVADAENYCRHTKDNSIVVLWCFTDDKYMEKESCDIPNCDDVIPSTVVSQTTENIPTTTHIGKSSDSKQTVVVDHNATTLKTTELSTLQSTMGTSVQPFNTGAIVTSGLITSPLFWVIHMLIKSFL